ncbi:adenosylmethionine decarboxylase [Alteromonas sp. 5E99-2]|uniref:adenosylmethionine decarboxylase n=1 Tax=Alteromonas sp. 5E99-2 TaxID=2817683 RepID=UPI001A986338|nr:adenosylmethionine decarboxylase [Alteromonas sp. 5E99-2]MBO1255775.1 adenosylmethionine decarboxylase [Alteromonas sp. 5E99-2]
MRLVSQQASVKGKHLLINLYEAKHLTSCTYIEEQLERVVRLCGATLLDINIHSFGENQGVTGVAMLAESHISIHTWPENGFAAIDVFMCGDCDPENAVAPLEAAFEAKRIEVTCIHRGTVGNSEKALK